MIENSSIVFISKIYFDKNGFMVIITGQIITSETCSSTSFEKGKILTTEKDFFSSVLMVSRITILKSPTKRVLPEKYLLMREPNNSSSRKWLKESE